VRQDDPRLAEGPDAREIVFVAVRDGPIRVRRTPVVLVAERE
jgi:hypothetical protein